MKKQLLTLALLTLGYVTNSHSMGVAVLAHMNRFKETMAVGETQMVRGADVRIISQTPQVPGQTVIEVDEIVSGSNKGKWNITTKNLGLAVIEIDKRIGGHTKKFHTAEHDITVTEVKKGKKKRVTDTDGLVVDSIQSVETEDEGIEVDAEDEIKDDVFNDVE